MENGRQIARMEKKHNNVVLDTCAAVVKRFTLREMDYKESDNKIAVMNNNEKRSRRTQIFIVQ